MKAVPRDGELPLSWAQERLWFLDQLESGNTAFTLSEAYRLQGGLNHEALRDSLKELIRRHEILRSVFPSVGGRPAQVISSRVDLELTTLDLTSLSERERKARCIAKEEAERAFDLERGPLFRACLLRLSESEHVFVLSQHLIVGDAWSQGVLSRELTALYRAFAAGDASPLKDPSIQYADFAVWQREWLSGERLEEQLSYWRKKLAGLPRLDLPTDRPRPARQSYRRASCCRVLSKELSEALARLSVDEGGAPYMTLLAAFAALLSRYTGQEDIVLGSPVSNRNREELEGLVGFFANTLALRMDLSGNPSSREFLNRVRETDLDAYAHGEMPIARLIEEIQPESLLSGNPLFPVFFDKPTAGTAPAFLGIEGLDVDRFEPGGTVESRFDLALCAREKAGSLEIKFVYDAELFDAVRMMRMLGALETMIEGFVTDPDRRLSELPLLSKAERHQLLVEWSGDGGAAPRPVPCLHTQFEAQVRRRPELVALVFGDRELTYRELNERANRLARYLRRCGLRAGVPVAICLARPPEVAIALLAVVKAGGFYVALDPRSPETRLKTILRDVGASWIVTQSSLSHLFPKCPGDIVCLDLERDRIESEPAEDLDLVLTSEGPAYVAYTSGSTGGPKGVLVPHRAVASFLEWMVGRFGVDENDVVLQVAPLSFDMMLRGLMGPLIVGARVVLMEEASVADPRALLTEVEQHGVSCLLGIVPSLLAECLEEAESRAFQGSPRLLLTVGENLPRSCVDRARAAFGAQLEIVNQYGATECYGATSYVSPRSATGDARMLPIGRCRPHTSMFVLDSTVNPVPMGAVGELCVSGMALAHGYWSRPGLSADKFIPNPFGSERGDRLYRTGDLVRYRSDGELEFVGRVDDQINLRGVRMEPGEIESMLIAHPAVSGAAVAVREAGAGDQRLVAYFVSTREPGPQGIELRRYLQKHLPDYMLPSHFVRLSALPTTSSGKIDRARLPVNKVRVAEGAERSAGFGSPIEEIVAGIWAQVLGVKEVKGQDHFFELGGHSLLATQVISRIRRMFSVELPLRTLFERPTVSELSEAVSAALKKGTTAGARAIRAVKRDGELPLSFAQERLWFLEQLEPGNTAYNLMDRYRLTGRVDTQALERSLRELIRRHEILRTRFTSVEGRPVQMISDEEDFELPVIELGSLGEDEREREASRIAKEEAEKGFHLSRGPLFQALLLHYGGAEHELLLSQHHIVWDAWSGGILSRELTALYRAFSAGEPSPLKELPIQYADFAVWQREWLSGARLAGLASYWRKKLDRLPRLELSTDRPRPARQSHRGGSCRRELSKELSEGLKKLSVEEGTTLYMTLLAAFASLLSRYAGQEDIVVGSPVSNRNREELEGLIGFFVNTLLLRVDLSGNPSFRELLGRVRETALEAYAHQEMPVERIIEELQPERDLSANPLFQVFFNMPTAASERAVLEVEGLEVERLDTGGAVRSKFDVTLYARERERGVELVLVYNADVFEGIRMVRMLGALETLIEGVVCVPERRLSELPLLSKAQRHQILVEWNDTQRGSVPECCVHELFEAQVSKSPGATAVVSDTNRLTYRELNNGANAIAYELIGRGVGKGCLVPVLMNGGVDVVTSFLAIMKAGAAFVPLDPLWPSERLREVLNEIDSRVVLVDAENSQRSTSIHQLVVGGDAVKAKAVENPRCGSTWDEPIYVMYTSGSTGKPKGVVIPHRGIVNRLFWMSEYFGDDTASAVLQTTRHVFDSAVWQFFWPLLHGGRSVILPPAMEMSAENLGRLIDRHEITTTDFVPSVFNTLLPDLVSSDGASRQWKSLRNVIIGGEEISAQAVFRFRDCFPDVRVINFYGPTEASIGCIHYEVREREARRIPIGVPISNVQALILDQNRAPVPIGAVGELYLSGVCLGDGYLQDETATAVSFVENPVAEIESTRLYRTGDLARYCPDGNIDFLGRVDQQVKIRGHRVEPAEIEQSLLRHAQIRDAVVLAHEVRPGDRNLVGYFVAQTDKTPTTRELRSFLKERVPHYMVPSMFVPVEQISRTPSGKVDRRRLPRPQTDQQERTETYVAPRSPTEKALAGILADLLKLERVGLDDDFFELGGHSLLAVRLMAQIDRRLGVKLALASLFEESTVEGLARLIQRPRPEASPSPLVRLRTGDLHRPFFCVHPVGGEVLCYLDLARHLAPGRPVYGLRAHGGSEEAPLRRTIERMATDYLEAIQTVDPVGPFLLGGWSMGGVVAYEMARQLRSKGQEVGCLILIDSAPPTSKPALAFGNGNELPAFARNLGLTPPAEFLLKASLEEGLREILLRGRDGRMIGDDIDFKQIRTLYELFENNVRATRVYSPGRYDGAMVLFNAERINGERRVRGWERLAAKVECHAVVGDHWSIMREPRVRSLSVLLEPYLEGV